MNRLYIASSAPAPAPPKTHYLPLAQAPELLPLLRSDYFAGITLALTEADKPEFKFLMHFTRLTTNNGVIIVQGPNEIVSKYQQVLVNLGLFVTESVQSSITLGKTKPSSQQQEKKEGKLAIGFKTQNEEQVDEDELLKNENINLAKTQASCDDKPRACANCNCGRKKDEPLPDKKQLIKSVNEGKPVSGCGKCYLGDSFRCATCPYQGLPAFKPGDKLKLVDDTKVVVEQTGIVNQNGKVKIQI